MKQVTCENLCFKGLRVKVDPNCRVLDGTCVGDFYKEKGYVIVEDCDVNNDIVGVGGEDTICVTISKKNLLPDLSDVKILVELNKKKEELKRLEGEVAHIEKFINDAISTSL